MPDETKDTQPLLKDILEEMRSGFAQLREEMHAGFAAIEKELHIMSKQIGNIEKHMGRILAEHEDLDERVSKLERPSGIQ